MEKKKAGGQIEERRREFKEERKIEKEEGKT